MVPNGLECAVVDDLGIVVLAGGIPVGLPANKVPGDEAGLT